MKIINLYGAPGAGKSVIMHGLTYELKKMGLNVESTPEFIKEMIFEESKVDRFGGQLYILAEQNRRISRLVEKADFIITDCPLLLIASYTPKEYIEGFESMAINLANSYDNVNYFLNRNLNFEFEKENRIHNEAQSDKRATEIREYLKTHKCDFLECTSNDFLVSELIDDLIYGNIITTEHLQSSRNPQVKRKFKVK